jgi:hypothetical protein
MRTDRQHTESAGTVLGYGARSKSSIRRPAFCSSSGKARGIRHNATILPW